MSTATDNIIRVYGLSTDQERTAGREWYADANRLAVVLAHTPDHRPGVTREQAAGVIAALSPLTPWNRNKELAVRAVSDGHASGTLGNSVRAADRILAGEDPLSVLKSDKVRNFYLSIMGSDTAVCIDRHALEVFHGKRYTNKDRPPVGKRLYREAADAYREAAQHLNNLGADITPTALQAITWLAWRRIHLTGTAYANVL